MKTFRNSDLLLSDYDFKELLAHLGEYRYTLHENNFIKTLVFSYKKIKESKLNDKGEYVLIKFHENGNIALITKFDSYSRLGRAVNNIGGFNDESIDDLVTEGIWFTINGVISLVRKAHYDIVYENGWPKTFITDHVIRFESSYENGKFKKFKLKKEHAYPPKYYSNDDFEVKDDLITFKNGVNNNETYKITYEENKPIKISLLKKLSMNINYVSLFINEKMHEIMKAESAGEQVKMDPYFDGIKYNTVVWQGNQLLSLNIHADAIIHLLTTSFQENKIFLDNDEFRNIYQIFSKCGMDKTNPYIKRRKIEPESESDSDSD